MENRDPLRLGIFMPNCSHTMSISRFKPDPDDWTFESNLRIARAAEAAGFDFIFPVSRWKGFGGATDYMGDSLETMTWAAALLASTSTLHIFSTVHVPVFHPVVAAKMGATLDHLSGGRWGINIVSGWNKPEFDMMGIDMLPHEDRYQRTADFITCLKGLWTEPPGTFDFKSRYYTIRGGYGQPQPQRKPHPPIVNAGTSEDAREVVSRHCDMCFIAPTSFEDAEEVARDVKRRAEAKGRTLSVVAGIMPIWDADRARAEALRERIVAEADREAIDNWAAGLGMESESFDNHTYDMFAFGGGSLPLIGTPGDVVEGLCDLYERGIDGVLMSFLRYEADTVRMGEELFPGLRRAGVIP